MIARTPRGHVAKAIAEGKRPFLTCTVSGETFRALDRLATAAGLSRGRMVDRLIADALRVNVDAAKVPCACGASDAHWEGDTMRVYACDVCHAVARPLNPGEVHTCARCLGTSATCVCIDAGGTSGPFASVTPV